MLINVQGGEKNLKSEWKKEQRKRFVEEKSGFRYNFSSSRQRNLINATDLYFHFFQIKSTVAKN